MLHGQTGAVALQCWKCGTACIEELWIGLFCPAPDCDVADSVGLSPEEFAAYKARNPSLFSKPASDPVEWGDEELRVIAADAKKRGLVLMVMNVPPSGQDDGG